MMQIGTRTKIATGTLLCIVFGAALTLFVQFVWQAAGERDSQPHQAAFKNQMMNRKTAAMQDILDGMVRGNARQVEKAATKMKSIGFHLDWYLGTPLCEEEAVDFRDSVDDLNRAMSDEDWDVAREAALRLERSCIECHAKKNEQIELNE